MQFLDPVGDTAPFSDVSKHILAASMPAGQRKDMDATNAGAQYDVVACTTATNGTAVLMGARQGDTLQQIATATRAGGHDASSARRSSPASSPSPA